jgi:hypothetical protein
LSRVIVIDLGVCRKMHEYSTEAVGDIREDLPQVYQPVMEDDVQVAFRNVRVDIRTLPVQRLDRYVPFACEKGKNIPQAEDVIAESILMVVVVKIKVDPAELTRVPVDDYMVTADIAVQLSVEMEIRYRFHSSEIPSEEIREDLFEINSMVLLHCRNVIGEILAVNEIDNPYVICCSIMYAEAMHETRTRADQLQDSRLLCRTADTVENERADPCLEPFVKDKLKDLPRPLQKIDRPLNPELLLFVDAEAAFPLIVSHEVRTASKEHHIVIIDAVKVGSVGVDPEELRDSRRFNPARGEIAEICIRKSHENIISCERFGRNQSFSFFHRFIDYLRTTMGRGATTLKLKTKSGQSRVAWSKLLWII